MMSPKDFDQSVDPSSFTPVFSALDARVNATSESQRLRRIMGGAGHDLKQPLQVIAFVLSRLTTSCADEREAQWLQAAIDQSSRLNAGLDELLESSRQSWWRLDRPARRRINIGDLLADCERDWALFAMNAGVELSVISCRSEVCTDPRLLKAILDNLVSNAIKYAPKGRVVVGCRRRDGSLWLEVSDNGCGICNEDRDKIFEPFHQLDMGQEGVGLGLSLVKDHCETLGHDLRLRSAREAGTTVAVALGLRQPVG